MLNHLSITQNNNLKTVQGYELTLEELQAELTECQTLLQEDISNKVRIAAQKHEHILKLTIKRKTLPGI